MNAPASTTPAFRARNLLGVLAFLMRYRGGVALAIGLLLFNIGLEMTLPQVSGGAINKLQKASSGLAKDMWRSPGPWWFFTRQAVSIRGFSLFASGWRGRTAWAWCWAVCATGWCRRR